MKGPAGISLLLLLLLGACRHYYPVSAEGNTLTVMESKVPNRIDSIVSPYSSQLEEEMGVVIAFADMDLVKGRPNGALNNWAADALFDYEVKKINISLPVFALLNVGGLRSSISKGDVTVGDMYTLMPFDNEVVWVEMPRESLGEVAEYLVKSGGEPISGVKLESGKLTLNGLNDSIATYWIITSDYLMNGGDKMTFFEKKVNVRYSGILLRDLFIQVARSQGTLKYTAEERITK